MSKNRTIEQRQARARRALQKASGQAAIDAAGELAEANIKTMTVERAEAWARDFIAEHPNLDAAYWAGVFVGEVKMFRAQRRGPKPLATQAELTDIHRRIIRLVSLRFPAKPSSADMDEIEREVLKFCDANSVAPPSRLQIRSAL